MKKMWIIVAIVLFGCINTYAQKGDTEITKESSFKERLYKGGGFGLAFSKYETSFSLSPILGYMIANGFSLGIGATYQFLRYQDINVTEQYNIYGWHVFTMKRLAGRVFAYGALKFTYFSIPGGTNFETLKRLPVGLSYAFDTGASSNLFFVATYDLLSDVNGTFNNPINYGFFFTF